MNLLHETMEALCDFGKTIDDVQWIGTKNMTIPVENFLEVANDYYDNDYGTPMVADDLVIVGDGWWLERYEYDGAESWVFKTAPKKPSIERKVDRVISEYWGGSLEDIIQEGLYLED